MHAARCSRERLRCDVQKGSIIIAYEGSSLAVHKNNLGFGMRSGEMTVSSVAEYVNVVVIVGGRRIIEECCTASISMFTTMILQR